MKLKAVIFDFDGTLFDSMSIWETLGEDYLRTKGIQAGADLPDRLKTLSLCEAAVLFQREYDIRLDAQTIMGELNGMIEMAYREEVRPKAGAEELVRELNRRSIACGIATATDRFLIEAALMRCGMIGLFEGIFTCSEAGSGKDRPDVYREAAKGLGADRRCTVIFEDALHAAKTAKRDGFITIAVYDAYEEHQAELKELCDGYLTDLSDTGHIVDMIRKLTAGDGIEG